MRSEYKSTLGGRASPIWVRSGVKACQADVESNNKSCGV